VLEGVGEGDWKRVGGGRVGFVGFGMGGPS